MMRHLHHLQQIYHIWSRIIVLESKLRQRRNWWYLKRLNLIGWHFLSLCLEIPTAWLSALALRINAAILLNNIDNWGSQGTQDKMSVCRPGFIYSRYKEINAHFRTKSELKFNANCKGLFNKIYLTHLQCCVPLSIWSVLNRRIINQVKPEEVI